MSVESNKTYYLAHPLTTCGNEHDNRIDEGETAELIEAVNPGVQLVRPLKEIPTLPDADYAMEQCYKLLDGCDGVIFCGDWEHSDGCLKEMDFAKKTGKEIYVFPNLVVDYRRYEHPVQMPADDVATVVPTSGTVEAAPADADHNQTAVGEDGAILLHQDYYSSGGMECGDYIEAKNMNFNMGNIIKYATRAGHKPGVTAADDLRKVINYAQRELDRVTQWN